MTPSKIIEGNVLIAEFMQREYESIYDLNYRCSWDWLMPVVEKIMDLCRTQATFICHRFFVGVSSINIKIEGQHRDFSNIDYFFTDSESRMIAIYSAAVDFIKWYNQ